LLTEISQYSKTGNLKLELVKYKAKHFVLDLNALEMCNPVVIFSDLHTIKKYRIEDTVPILYTLY
jgi:hypothetical protein